MSTTSPSSSFSSPISSGRFCREKINSEFREIFNLIDRDGGGTITVEEMGLLIETLGIKASPEEIKQLVAEIDKDKNGEIDFQEFVSVMSQKVKTNYTSREVKYAFRVFKSIAVPSQIETNSTMRSTHSNDTTCNENKVLDSKAFNEKVLKPLPSGQIHMDKLITALTTYGSKKLSVDEAHELLNQLEPDGQDLIYYSEYVDLMMDGY